MPSLRKIRRQDGIRPALGWIPSQELPVSPAADEQLRSPTSGPAHGVRSRWGSASPQWRPHLAGASFFAEPRENRERLRTAMSAQHES